MPVEQGSSESPLMNALEKFEATEANIAKLERLWSELKSLVPDGITFGDDPDYDDKVRAYSLLLDALPMIDGWKPTMSPWSLNEIAQNRFDVLAGPICCATLDSGNFTTFAILKGVTGLPLKQRLAKSSMGRTIPCL